VSELAELLTAIAALLGALVGVYGVIVSRRNSRSILRVERATNGMQGQLIEAVRAEAHAAGAKQGREDRAREPAP
jgi:hypothetical protein